MHTSTGSGRAARSIGDGGAVDSESVANKLIDCHQSGNAPDVASDTGAAIE
jgi:hypothetical protein